MGGDKARETAGQTVFILLPWDVSLAAEGTHANAATRQLQGVQCSSCRQPACMCRQWRGSTVSICRAA